VICVDAEATHAFKFGKLELHKLMHWAMLIRRFGDLAFYDTENVEAENKYDRRRWINSNRQHPSKLGQQYLNPFWLFKMGSNLKRQVSMFHRYLMFHKYLLLESLRLGS
jgi:hypothetical protein